MDDPTLFTLDDADGAAAVLESLAERHELVTEPPLGERRTLLDTFDWRVWRRGTLLEAVDATDGTLRSRARRLQLRWSPIGGGRPLAQVDDAAIPTFAADLPAGRMADELGPVLSMRALQPLVAATTTTTVHRVLDDETKTVARLRTVVGSVDGGERLPTVIEVVPVRGYDRVARRLTKELRSMAGVRVGGLAVPQAALVAGGHEPGAYSSKLRLDLDPGASAAVTWSEVLTSLLGTLRANEDGTRRDLDSEFLHDLRVAVRRTRSVLAQGKGVLDPEARTHFAAGFRWLGGATSPTRDLDVWLLTLPELAAGIDADLARDLGPLRELLVRHQRREHGRLVRAMDSGRYADLLRTYEVWVADPAGTPELAPDARRPGTAVAGHRIARAHRRVVRDGRRIGDDDPPEALHELRKDAKRLRYALECFGSLFPAEHSQRLVRDLKALQDVLGEFQDCEVQVTSLRSYADELAGRGAPSTTLLAMGAMVEQLAERQAAARRRFTSRFEDFDSATNGEIVAAVFAAGKGRRRPTEDPGARR